MEPLGSPSCPFLPQATDSGRGPSGCWRDGPVQTKEATARESRPLHVTRGGRATYNRHTLPRIIFVQSGPTYFINERPRLPVQNSRNDRQDPEEPGLVPDGSEDALVLLLLGKVLERGLHERGRRWVGWKAVSKSIRPGLEETHAGSRAHRR